MNSSGLNRGFFYSDGGSGESKTEKKPALRPVQLGTKDSNLYIQIQSLLSCH